MPFSMKYHSSVRWVPIVLSLFVLTSCMKKTHSITIHSSAGDYSVQVELAKTEAEKTRGLMHRDQLPEGNGMLFIYDTPLHPSFWMKNTEIPLDMLFIGSDFKIKNIAPDQKPCGSDSCPGYQPLEDVQYVLELSAGSVAHQKIEVGNSVDLGSIPR